MSKIILMRYKNRKRDEKLDIMMPDEMFRNLQNNISPLENEFLKYGMCMFEFVLIETQTFDSDSIFSCRELDIID